MIHAFIVISTIPTEIYFYVCQCLISNVIKPWFLQLLTEIRSTTLRTVVSKKRKARYNIQNIDARAAC